MIPEKLQQTQDELGEDSSTITIPILKREALKIKAINFELFVTDTSASNSLICGHPVNGVVGIATGLGGGQIVVGDTSGSVTQKMVNRRYDWKTMGDFQQGTKSDNMDISFGDLRYGNIVVKDIYLEYKQKW